MKPVFYITRQLHRYAGPILYANLVGMTMISLLEGIGILLLIPMLSMISFMNFEVEIFAPIVRLFQTLSPTLGLIVILGLFMMIIIVQTWLQRNLTIRDTRIHTGFINDLRLRTYDSLLQANWDFFVKKRKSDLIQFLTGELGRVSGGAKIFLQFMTSVIFTFIQIGIAFWLSPVLTVIILLCGLILAYLSRQLVSRSQKVGSMTIDNAKEYLGGITDHFNGIKDIKSNMLESSRKDWLRQWNKKAAREHVEYVIIQTQSQLYYKLTSAALIVTLIFASVQWFQIGIEQVILITVIFSRLWPRFSSLQANMQQMAATIPSIQALIALQDECRRSKEVEHPYKGAVDLRKMQLRSRLRCQNIRYRYDQETAEYAIDRVSLQIPANSMTALIGPSGAGKSTLIDVIMGLLKPEEGEIWVDDERLTADNLLSYRKMISYVPQDPFLFNGSIRENLQMMMPEASEEQLWEALDFASATEFVQRLPRGLDTHIGDRGVRLSGGERQRLVLARAILKKPAILVLDEATSALDSENEMNIQRAIERMKGQMTMIVIAHRMSTIRHADQVIELERGQVKRVMNETPALLEEERERVANL